MTGSAKIANKLDADLHYMVVNREGRIYYNLNNWYSVIAIFPFSKVIIKIWQRMLGVQDKEIIYRKVKISPLKKLLVAKNIYRSIHTIPQEMTKLANYFAIVEKEFYSQDLSKLSNDDLVKLYIDLRNKLLERWEVTLANDMYAFFYTHRAEKHIDNAKEFISNIANLESMKPVRSLVALSEMAIKKNKIKELSNIDSDAKVDKFLAQSSAFSGSINKYIQKYGDRYLEELKLESETYRTKPLLLIHKIVEFAKNIENSKKLLKDKEPKLPKTNHRNQSYLEKAVLGIKNREISRLNRSRLYGMVRAIFTQLGVNYYKAGQLDDVKDIFWLTTSDIFDVGITNLKQKVKERKKQYAKYETIVPANRIIIENGEVIEITKNIKTSQLSGTPVSSGKTKGEALVVVDPKTVKDVTNKILVTKTTDPGWVFLMVNALGIISEKGSLLSHTAIVARELGIPAIVGAEDATIILKSGDIVELDCETGKVEIKNA
jgi:pyruvate,water dikinase